MSDEKIRGCVLATAKELYARAVRAHKVHEKEREIWSAKTSLMNRVNIALVSATTLSAVVSVALQPKWLLILTALSAAATTAFVLWQSNFDPVGKENRHRTTAKELLCARESLLFLIMRCNTEIEPADRPHLSLESITRELTTIYKFAPDTSPRAYRLAGVALREGEYSMSAEEIDACLPQIYRTGEPSRIIPTK